MRGQRARRNSLKDIVLREWDAWAKARNLSSPANGNDGFAFFLALARQRTEVALVEWQQVHAWLIQGGRTN